ncbi:MAG TPA: M48 family metallopeptidase [Gemmatimonadales bacterium]|nr:M48 family metallopeptidase [Gemmatimonadales bacterium]
MSAANLFAQQAANRRRSGWLVAGFVLFFAWVGFGGDYALYLLTAGAPRGAYHHAVPFIGLLTTLAAGALCYFSWKTGPRRVLLAAGAWEVVTPASPAQQQLLNVVEEMAIAAGLPRPTVWVVPDADLNAFATGHDPRHASIAVTEGLLQALDRDELQGVVAHEMSHIQNDDVKLMTLLAGMLGAVALLSDAMGRFLRSGGRVGGGSSGGGGRNGGKGGNPLAAVVLVLWLFTLLMAPVISRLLAMAVSRKREFLADATGAQLSRHPEALARALEKLDAAAAPTRSITQGAAHLCIVDPAERKVSDREGLVGDVFASHPPIRQRVARLKAMAFQQAKRDGSGLPA